MDYFEVPLIKVCCNTIYTFAHIEPKQKYWQDFPIPL
jgi:hypothetical protein